MIENILDLKNQIVEVEKLSKVNLEDLKIMREEIRLISNKTPVFYIINNSDKTYLNDSESKITAFDSLWAHVNIAIAKMDNEKKDPYKHFWARLWQLLNRKNL